MADVATASETAGEAGSDAVTGILNLLAQSFTFVKQDDLGNYTVFGQAPEAILIKAVYLLVIVVLAFVVQRLLVRLAKRVIGNIDSLPSASIILNCIRIVVWIVALIAVLEPVFGIQPSVFLGTLGVMSIVISLGLKDTIANIIGGFMLMVGKVIQPGDYVTVAGITGTVVDVTIRHTVVENRLEERIVIPNSVLNSTSIERLPASSESQGTIEFTMELGNDPDVVAADIVATAKRAAGEKLRDDIEPRVFFDSITPYGAKGQVYFYVVPGVPFGGVRDKIVRAIAEKDYFSNKGARALAQDLSSGMPEEE